VTDARDNATPARPPWASEADVDTPSPARVYDYFLGGSHNFETDRRMAARLAQVMPDIGDIMRANRSFLRRAVRFLAGAGVRQFLDLGSGIPTVGNVHEIAQQAAPEARVVYVDIDPVAIAHSRAVLATNPLTTVVEADMREPDTVLADAVGAGLLDLAQPVAVLLVGVLHQVPGDLRAMVDGYRRVLAAESYLALSHATRDTRRAETEAFRQTFNRGYAPGVEMTFRTRAEVLALFDGLELVEPGLVQLPQWRPEAPGDVGENPERFSTYAGVGRRTAPTV
jgi:SAM-dependent methyltransferase